MGRALQPQCDGPDALVVLDDNSKDGSTDDLPCSVIRIPEVTKKRFFERSRMKMASGVAAGPARGLRRGDLHRRRRVPRGRPGEVPDAQRPRRGPTGRRRPRRDVPQRRARGRRGAGPRPGAAAPRAAADWQVRPEDVQARDQADPGRVGGGLARSHRAVLDRPGPLPLPREVRRPRRRCTAPPSTGSGSPTPTDGRRRPRGDWAPTR